MRSLQRRKQDVWATTATLDDSTVEGSISYSNPVHFMASVSNTSGTPNELPVGIVAEYSRYLVSYDRDLELEEGTNLFIDRTPQLNQDGSLTVDENGVPLVSPDYVVSHIMDTMKGTIARYGIRKIAGEDE